MKKLILSAIIIIIGLMFISCAKKSGTKETNEKKLSIIKANNIEGKEFRELYKVVGIVKPYASAKISSEEGGLITYLKKDKGDYVYRGEVLVRLKKDVDNAVYEQALAQYNLAKENFERIERLYNDNAATEQQYMNTKLQLEVALKSVDLYKTRLSKGYVSSPISGIIDAKLMNRGEMTSPGMPILSIVDISRVKINAGIPERFLEKLKTGKKVKITFDALPDDEFEGEISYISPTLNSQSKTIEIEIVIINSGRKIKPEMSANVELTVLELKDAIVLQQDLIIDNGDEKFVFILEGDIAKKRIVKTGANEGNDVLVTEGLNEGDKIIYEGFGTLADGDKVIEVK
jgi:RND family efflux transporter MFP subunit